MKQTTFVSLAFDGKNKQTRRERFLAEMEVVVPWATPPMPLETMLRIYCLQQ